MQSDKAMVVWAINSIFKYCELVGLRQDVWFDSYYAMLRQVDKIRLV